MKTSIEICKGLQPDIEKLPRFQGYTIISTQKEWDLYERYSLLGPGYHIADAYDRPIMSELPFAVKYDYNVMEGGADFVCFSYLSIEALERLLSLLREAQDGK